MPVCLHALLEIPAFQGELSAFYEKQILSGHLKLLTQLIIVIFKNPNTVFQGYSELLVMAII